MSLVVGTNSADCAKRLFGDMSDDVRSGRLNSSRSLTDAEAISVVVASRFDRNPEVRRAAPEPSAGVPPASRRRSVHNSFSLCTANPPSSTQYCRT